MTDQASTNPLGAARELVTQLQAAADATPIDPAALKAQLARLDSVLIDAIERGAGSDADQVRAELDRVVADSTSFSSMMVHEIRKPMTSIRGYADMLAKPGMIGPLNEMQTQFITTIRSNVIRMEGLVADISDISKLNSGRLRLDNKMTTFGQIVMEVQKGAESLVVETGHTVTWDVPQGLPILTLDSKQLAKVLLNLVRNAIQYTPGGNLDLSALSDADRSDIEANMATKGGGQITVRAERLDNNVLHVTVSDNGIGLKPEEVARLGELFYRADHPLVTLQKGYGLGVPIAMGFLRMMGSQLEIDSAPGVGSTFGFRLAGMG